jgi:hypothetical protein
MSESVDATTYNTFGLSLELWANQMAGGKYAYVTWSDGRTGDWIDGIMSRVPLSLYNCGSARRPRQLSVKALI